ncbi:unnamed protein product [Caenorhabditis brenneri]
MEEYTPLILDEFFIKNCIQYEYLKNPESPRQAFKNISEMLISDIVRSDVQWRGDGIRLTPEPDLPPPEYFEPGPLFPKPDPESSDDTTATDIDMDDEEEKEEEPEPEHPNPDEEEEDVHPGKRRQGIRLTPDPDLPPPEYFEPGPLFPKPDPEFSDDTPVTNIDDYEDKEKEKKEEPVPEHQNPEDDEEDVRPGKRRQVVVDSIDSARTSIETTDPRSIFDELIKSDDIDVDSDDSMIEFPMRSCYTLLKKDEEDCSINAISLHFIFAYYDNAVEWSQYNVWPKVNRRKVRLSELRMWAFTFYRLSVIQQTELCPLQQPFNQVRVVIDHSKIKIILSDSTKNAENLKFEYWEDEKGSLVWFNNSVRFIEGFHFETLAANEFLHILSWALPYKFMEPMLNLEKLEFDVEDHHKWSPPHYPSPDFFRKIKRFFSKYGKCVDSSSHSLYVKHYSFKLYRFETWDHLMIPLEFVSPNCIKEITIKIWDDSHLKRSKRRYTKYLDYLDRNGPWKSARRLDIQDPYLEGFLPDIQNFKEVNMWNVTPEVLEKMRKIFGKQVPESKKISVKTGYTKELEKFGILKK